MVSSAAVVIDTNIYINFVKGDDKVARSLLAYDVLLVPVIVIGELAFGFLNSARQEENFKTLEEFLSQPQVSIIRIDEVLSMEYGTIKNGLKT